MELLAATWSAAGPRVATLSAAGLVEVWSDAHGAARPWLTRSLGAGFRATASTTSADGTVLALGSSTGEVALTSLDGDAPPVFATTADGTRASHGSPVSALALGAGRLASASAEGDIRLWSLPVAASHTRTIPSALLDVATHAPPAPPITAVRTLPRCPQ